MINHQSSTSHHSSLNSSSSSSLSSSSSKLSNPNTQKIDQLIKSNEASSSSYLTQEDDPNKTSISFYSPTIDPPTSKTNYSNFNEFNYLNHSTIENENPFADLKSNSTFNFNNDFLDTSNLFPSSSIPTQSNFSSNQFQNDPSSSSSSEFNLTNKFSTSSSNLNSMLDQDVGFDGKPLEISINDPFSSFDSNQSNHFNHHSNSPIESSLNNLMIDNNNDNDNDNDHINNNNHDDDDLHQQISFSSSHQSFDQSVISPSSQSPSSPNTTFRGVSKSSQSQSVNYSNHSIQSNHQDQKSSIIPNSPIFKPFGVTATLTSSNDDNFDQDFTQSTTSSTLRPTLPDILGGGNIGNSLLSIDSRSTMPAFKKSPQKSFKTPKSSSEKNSTTHQSNQSSSQPVVEVTKPYRPLGLKIAQPKPILVTPPQPTQSSSSSFTDSSKLNLHSNDLAISPKTTLTFPQSQLATSNHLADPNLPKDDGIQQQSNLSINHLDTSYQALTESSDPSPVSEAQDLKGPTTSTSPTLQHEATVDQPVSPTISNLNTSEPQISTTIIEPIENIKTVDASLTSLPLDDSQSTYHATLTKQDRDEPKESQAQPMPVISHPSQTEPQNQSVLNSSTLSTTIISPSTSTPASNQRAQRTESESEDERPLSSVREGLVQQQQQEIYQQQQHRQYHADSTTHPRSVSLPSQMPLSPSCSLLQPAGPLYKCSVGDPQKIGMINDIHTVYTVRTVATNPNTSGPLKASSTVLRRFRDFVWLFEALTSNNPGIIVPPIPDKNLRHRFQEGFIAARRVALEIFLQKTVNHPMLISDPDLKLFLESDSFSLEIKHRKHDSTHQPGWLANIAGPRFTETDDFFDNRKIALDSLESQLKALHSSLTAASKTRRAMSQSLSELSQALSTLSTCDLSKPIRNTLDKLATLHRQCHNWSEEQSKSELEGLTATIEAYSRLTNSVRLTFVGRIKSWEKWQFSLNHMRKVQLNHEKTKRSAANEHSTALMYSLAELEEAERREHDARNEFADVSKLIKAEMERFNKEKVEDFKESICAYVDGLTQRQRQIVKVWQEYYQLLQALSRHNAEANVTSKQSGSSEAIKSDKIASPSSEVPSSQPPLQHQDDQQLLKSLTELQTNSINNGISNELHSVDDTTSAWASESDNRQTVLKSNLAHDGQTISRRDS
ncbi:hypothetical protein O181_056293 [Austropuccinia psidii MF-1]|uniref:PX domain-containing protein n=1 Tax=Austropuccinia psidii MF-1 TaxID=1389203 RepID=A0A9Q3HTA7_9BASI|nr:hypothetical protein [Austropuccinia psidii MF-1]